MIPPLPEVRHHLRHDHDPGSIGAVSLRVSDPDLFADWLFVDGACVPKPLPSPSWPC
jgi:hypothetical protein